MLTLALFRFLAAPIAVLILVLLVATAALVALLAGQAKAARAIPILLALLEAFCSLFGAGSRR
ncbi:hypothetical protein [Rhodococcus sp. 14-2483-1-2]|uniref:hypothetical protein n=1 Tax=Rhodococcus sp. 14-2483-1-2 TaxID=2023147 RepID=UPI000B9B5F46|nr:hypothetical protein [Rhodococcus sp. 14-2483-1-2]OZF33581.1 hypothetical protein CH295_11430 [Rhodococcus sp. 14-2483-1-2]